MVIPVTISSRSSAFTSDPTRNSAAGSIRRRDAEAISISPSSICTIIGISAAGSAWQTLPQNVPRLRTVICATWRIASCRTGILRRIAGLLATIR